MSFVTVDTQVLNDTSDEVDDLADLLAASSTVAAGMTPLAPAATDRVSTLAAESLARQARDFQQLSAEYAGILRHYAGVLRTAGAAYAATEAENAEGVE